MCSNHLPREPILTGPIDRTACAHAVSAVLGQFQIRAGHREGEVYEVGRRLLLLLAPGERVYAASTATTPTYTLAIVIATDHRLLVGAEVFHPSTINTPWLDLSHATAEPKDDDDTIYTLTVQGVPIRLTGHPRHGAAALHAIAINVLDRRDAD